MTKWVIRCPACDEVHDLIGADYADLTFMSRQATSDLHIGIKCKGCSKMLVVGDAAPRSKVQVAKFSDENEFDEAQDINARKLN